MTKLPLLLLLAALAPAADLVAQAQAAMGNNDASDKKTALKALAAKSSGPDEVVIPILLSALTDRQAGEAAVSALKARTGASPKGGTWITGKESQTVEAWTTWWVDQQQKKKVTDLEKKAEAAKPTTAKPEAAADTPAVETPVEAKPERTTTVPDDLGRIDRILLKAGGSMVAYIQSRRTDADGNLVSVRVIHPDGGGEEILPASLISRIDEDIR
jgi:hypothetical protein